MPTLKKLVGLKIKELREEHGLSRNQLGKAAGASHVTIGSIERGETATNVDLLESIARQLGVTPIELMTTSKMLDPIAAVDRHIQSSPPQGINTGLAGVALEAGRVFERLAALDEAEAIELLNSIRERLGETPASETANNPQKAHNQPNKLKR